MINLLSRHEQKKIYHEYLLRIASLIFCVVGVVGAIFIAVLIPSYMRLATEIASVDTELKEKQAQMSADGEGQAIEAKEFMSEIQVLRSSGSTSSVVALVERIITLKPARVAITSVHYDATSEKSPISIRGKADRREDLQEFQSNLKTKGGFGGGDVPPQTLIKRTDIQFAMDLFYGESKTPSARSSGQPAPEDSSIMP